MIPEIRIEEFNYILPDEKIAKYPLPKRDSSKLLIYRDEKVSESSFSLLPDELPEDSMIPRSFPHDFIFSVHPGPILRYSVLNRFYQRNMSAFLRPQTDADGNASSEM